MFDHDSIIKMLPKNSSKIDEYLTPYWVAEIMFKLALKNGFSGGNILEPSFGQGVFFDVASELLPLRSINYSLYGFEITPSNFDLVKNRYPSAGLYKNFIETYFIEGKNRDKWMLGPKPALPEMDLVIGNPPYGNAKSPYQSEISKLFPSASMIRNEGFFVYLCSLLLKPGGLLVFIMPSLWMHSDSAYNKQKELIAGSGLELIDGYRLSSSIFKESITNKISGELATDILLFKKNSYVHTQDVQNLDDRKKYLLDKVEGLVAIKKGLYSNIDIQSPVSAEEKKLNDEISSIYSEINSIVSKKRDFKKQ